MNQDLIAANGRVAAIRIESKIGVEVFLSEDAREAAPAFMQKRRPEFKGRWAGHA